MVDKQPKFLSDKRDISQKFGNKSLMNKKPSQNSKYDDVKSTVDTGKSIRKVVLQSDQLISKRKSELFRRVKGGAIIKLLSETVHDESIYNLGNNQDGNINMADTNSTKGEKSVVNQDTKSHVSYKTQPSNIQSGISQTQISSSQIVGDLTKISKFVIVDLRDPQEYEKFHIKEAINMPYFNISRDKYPNEVYLIKNHMDKMIIAYSYDERNSIPHCQLIFQKGFDNIYMLSGGIEEFIKANPDYCDGTDITKIKFELQEKERIEKEKMNKPRYKSTVVGVKSGSTTNVINNKNKYTVIDREADEINKLNMGLNKIGINNQNPSVRGSTKSTISETESLNTLKKNLGYPK